MFLLNVFNSFGVSFLLVDVDWKKKKKSMLYDAQIWYSAEWQFKGFQVA